MTCTISGLITILIQKLACVALRALSLEERQGPADDGNDAKDANLERRGSTVGVRRGRGLASRGGSRLGGLGGATGGLGGGGGGLGGGGGGGAGVGAQLVCAGGDGHGENVGRVLGHGAEGGGAALHAALGRILADGAGGLILGRVQLAIVLLGPAGGEKRYKVRGRGRLTAGRIEDSNVHGETVRLVLVAGHHGPGTFALGDGAAVGEAALDGVIIDAVDGISGHGAVGADDGGGEIAVVPAGHEEAGRDGLLGDGGAAEGEEGNGARHGVLCKRATWVV